MLSSVSRLLYLKLDFKYFLFQSLYLTFVQGHGSLGAAGTKPKFFRYQEMYIWCCNGGQ